MMRRLTSALRGPSHIPILPDVRRLKQVLGSDRLEVADVGSTGGPDSRWRDCAALCHFLAFDPDPRAEEADPEFAVTNFAIGLWSSKTTRSLLLTSFPPASTVFDPNHAVLDDFLNAPTSEVIGVESITLDAMSSVLAGHAKPDFIKIDAEGAELEILRGADEFLAGSCLGIQVEASFVERNRGAPFFSDIDCHVRSFGFSLFDLVCHRLIRTTGFFGLTSRPQVIWGDAVYFLDAEHFLMRMAQADPWRRPAVFCKFLLLLLVYGAHDYAAEIAARAAAKGLIAEDLSHDALRLVKDATSHGLSHVAKLTFSAAIALGALVVLFPFGTLRCRARQHFRRRLRRLVEATAFWASRTDPYDAAVIGL